MPGGRMWMTYDEAAAALGIKSDSVRRQARLRSWPRRTGNDGKAQVDIPDDRLADSPLEIPTVAEKNESTLPPPDYAARLAGAEARADYAEKRVEELAQDRDRWQRMAEALRADLATERSVSRTWLDRLFRR